MRISIAFLIGILAPACLLGQGTFVYTNNERTDPTNTISAFALQADGALTPLPASPYSTGGVGAAYGVGGSKHILATPQGLLFVANGGSQNISVFLINSSDGTLSPVPGSPFPTGEPIDQTLSPMSLSVTPDGRYLIAAHSAIGHLNVFSIASNGALARTAASPFSVGVSLGGTTVTPDGRFLAVAHLPLGVAMFAISANGYLTAVPGTPLQIVPPGFPGSVIFTSGVDCNCASNLLFEAKFNNVSQTIVGVFDIASNGGLLPITGSPFVFPAGANSTFVALSPDNTLAFVSNPDSSSVSSFQIGPAGLPTPVPGTPVNIGGALSTGDLAVDDTGTFLFTAVAPNAVAVFRILPGGGLSPSPGSPFSTGYPGFGLSSLAAYPPKSCCPAPIVSGASASPNVLWPPNQKMIPVSLQYQVSAQCPIDTQISVAGAGPDDWQILDDHHVLLRADKDTPTYTLTITAANIQNGLSGSAIVTVTVPHDQGH